jgi:hypothetical protein
MGTATTAATPNAVAGASGQANATPSTPAPVRLAPFTRGSMKHQEPFINTAATATANGTQVSAQDVPSFGYLRGIWFLIAATGGTGTVAVATEDAPWSALSGITLSDVNGAQIVGPIDGFDLFLINLIGGYLDVDPRWSAAYSAVATSGNFSFLLWLPVEICERDALGALPNQNASSTYKLSFTYGVLANVYGTNPTTIPSVSVKCWLDAWTQPAPTDIQGNPQADVPPAFGTTQYWTRQQYNLNSGQQTVRLSRVGNVIRALIFLWRTTTPARSTTTFPDPFQLQLEGRIITNIGRDLLRFMGAQQSQQDFTFGDTTNPFPTGVFPYNFDTDLYGKSGMEMRDLWLPTSQATRLEVVGNFTGAGTLTVITNDIAPAGDYHLT